MNTQTQSSVATVKDRLAHPRSRSAFHTLLLLVGGYLALSLVTLGTIFALRNHGSIVNSAVWTRGSIVAGAALVMFLATLRALSGSRSAYIRVRIMSAAMVVAIAVIVALPGVFPDWLKLEQGVCGLVLVGVVAVANGKHLRSVFAGK